MSKVDGLLHEILQTLKISAADLVYAGDNWARDIVPAMEESVYAIHYDETDNISLHHSPIKIDTWQRLEFILNP